MIKGNLVLENGLILEGELFGHEETAGGEVVFNTALCGYQEIITDPSYYGQIVMMTYPLIGNYGTNESDNESGKVQVSGFIVCNYEDEWSNYQGLTSLNDYLKKNKVTAITGIDTRALTKTVRSEGAMRGLIVKTGISREKMLAMVNEIPQMAGSDLVKEVTATKSFDYNPKRSGSKYRLAVYDFGIKQNILKELSRYDSYIRVFPAKTDTKEILDFKPDGIFLSNGPGDPEAVSYGIENAKKLIPSGIPMFGICLGHQLISLALGGKTYKLKFGHRGANHPVKNKITNKIEITSQNHGFAVDENTLDGLTTEVTHTNLYDGTNEGLRHKKYPVFSVQYHPESSPGPNDSKYLFDEFIKLIESCKN